MTGARVERVRPVKSEGNLRYLEWVQSRREYVDRLSGGRIRELRRVSFAPPPLTASVAGEWAFNETVGRVSSQLIAS